MTLNPNEAPSGFVAVETKEGNNCTGCAFFRRDACALQNCLPEDRTDGTSVIFKLMSQTDLLNAATHEQRKQTVTISTELSDAYIALHRAVDSYLTAHLAINQQRVIDAHQQVLRAGGGK